MKTHASRSETYLCELGETPPTPGSGQYVDWSCSGCRVAWIAAVRNAIDPADAARHYEHARSVAERAGDPHFSRAVALLGLRVSA